MERTRTAILCTLQHADRICLLLRFFNPPAAKPFGRWHLPANFPRRKRHRAGILPYGWFLQYWRQDR